MKWHIHIDWSHSLLTSVFRALVFAGAFINRGKRIAMVMGLAALWPHSQVHLGPGLWRSLPNGRWFIELALVVAAWADYMRSSRMSAEFGGQPVAVGLSWFALQVFNSPWLSAL